MKAKTIAMRRLASRLDKQSNASHIANCFLTGALEMLPDLTRDQFMRKAGQEWDRADAAHEDPPQVAA